jgi:hypothetical protein
MISSFCIMISKHPFTHPGTGGSDVRKFAGEPLLFTRPDFGELIGRVFRILKPRPGELGFESFPRRASLD